MTIICWSLGIMACEPDPPTNPEHLDYPFTLENAVAAPDVEQAIDDFETYLGSARPDLLESIRIEDLIWSVEATLNRKYTNVAHQFRDLSSKSDTIPIGRAGDMVTGTDVHTFYDETVSRFSAHFYSLPNDNRLPVLVDVAEYADDTNSLIVTTQVGTGILEEMSTGFDLHWWWGVLNAIDAGTCGPDDDIVPASELRAANTELETEANNRILGLNNIDPQVISIPIDDCGMPVPLGVLCVAPVYTTNVETTTSFITWGDVNPNDDVPFDNCKDYLLYWNTPVDFSYEENLNYEDKKCIPPEDMDYYYDGLIQVMNDNRPTGKDFISVDVAALRAELDNDDVDDRILYHSPRYSYGEIIATPFNATSIATLPQ